MTSEDYSQYVDRLNSDLEQKGSPWYAWLALCAGGLGFWFLLGGAVLGIYYGLPLLVRMIA